MDTKTEVGQVNVSFEMESKQEDHAETCGEEDTPQAKQSKVVLFLKFTVLLIFMSFYF